MPKLPKLSKIFKKQSKSAKTEAVSPEYFRSDENRGKMASGSINFFVYTNVPKVDDERICPICTEEAPEGKPYDHRYIDGS